MMAALSANTNALELCVCRCCLAAGCDKDLLSSYLHSGVEEVYADMMKETFDIELPNAADNSHLLYICQDCINELRRAFAFKKSVITNTDAFNQHINTLKISQAGSDNTTTLKQEKVQSETEDANRDNSDSSHFDEIFYEDYTQPAANSETVSKRRTLRPSKRRIKEESECKKRRERDKTEERKRHRTEKRDNSKQITDAKIQQDKSIDLENGTAASKGEKNWARIAERRGNGPLLRENSLKLLANSTMCVFQWNKSRYRCFCCKEPFSDMTSLRTHTDTSHTLTHVEKIIIQQQNRLVKVEVSSLFCKLCSMMLNNIDELRTHLETTHGLEFKLCNEDLLVPFKLGSEVLQCQLCSEKFTVFRLLNIHMNKHYKKQVCHICGAAFSNLVFLNLHKSRNHRVLRCNDCDVEFSSRSEKRTHDMDTHKLRAERKLRFPCPFCQERFFQEKCRVLHLVQSHGMVKPEHACERCGKVFITRSLRNNHVKSVHQLKARSAECALCLKRFASRSDVTRHMVTHTRARSHACAACGGAFATRDSLRRHRKRSCAGASLVEKERGEEAPR